jgi:hypothetical protein
MKFAGYMKFAGFAILLVSFSSLLFGTPRADAPEIDSGVAGSALALIGGAVLIVRSRLRK